MYCFTLRILCGVEWHIQGSLRYTESIPAESSWRGSCTSDAATTSLRNAWNAIGYWAALTSAPSFGLILRPDGERCLLLRPRAVSIFYMYVYIRNRTHQKFSFIEASCTVQKCLIRKRTSPSKWRKTTK